MSTRQDIIEEYKEDATGNRGHLEQPDNEYSAELKAYLGEFKQALDEKNKVIENELWSLKNEVEKASEAHQRSIEKAQA